MAKVQICVNPLAMQADQSEKQEQSSMDSDLPDPRELRKAIMKGILKIGGEKKEGRAPRTALERLMQIHLQRLQNT